MRRSELRSQRRRLRRDAKRRQRQRRQRMRDQLKRHHDHPGLKAARDAAAQRRRRWRRRISIVLSLVLLALLLARCEGPEREEPAQATPTPTGKDKPAKNDRPFRARLESQERPGYSVAARPGPSWLDDFRLQVAARSPRLAACFNDSERGGALRWTASVDAKTGTVTGHDFEPLGSTTLTSAQKACATRALSHPGYRLKDPPSEALPNRVSLVLEF